ncbi:MAG: thiolase family protein [Bacteroidota bacterium]
MIHQRNAVIVCALRTPIGKYGGVLRDVRPDDLGAIVIKALVEKSGIDPATIDDVMWGCANQAGEDNRNIGRMSTLLAGLPHSVPASTINRLCASSLDCIIQAARAVWSGDAEVLIAGGVESMSRAPYSIPKNPSGSFGNVTAYDTALGWRYPNPKMKEMFPLESMGETAENVAEKYHISRAEQDEFALASHKKAVAAQERGMFRDEIVQVKIRDKKDHIAIVDKDEGPRTDATMERLSGLEPVFRKGGSVTAGNSSSLNDGAAAILVMQEEKAVSLGLQPLARIVTTGIVGVDPRFMGIGPVPASRKALAKAGLSITDIDVIELNEAFAAQALAVARDLQIPLPKLNPQGGAIALGHPLGCSGARITTTLIHQLKRQSSRYGMATMCVGVGQGVAVIVENVT